MIIKSQRLILRPPTVKDAAAVTENVKNIRVSENLQLVPHPYKKQDALKWIAKCTKNEKMKKRTDYSFLIEDNKTHKVIGEIGLRNIHHNLKSAEVAFWLGEPYWGNHVMSEAVGAVLDFGFNKLKLNRIYAYVFIENMATRKLLEKFDFMREGLRRHAGYSVAKKTVHHDYLYALLKSDYQKQY
jgi:RimJ/RimL family protein N-acetyltransferase